MATSRSLSKSLLGVGVREERQSRRRGGTRDTLDVDDGNRLRGANERLRGNENEAAVEEGENNEGEMDSWSATERQERETPQTERERVSYTNTENAAGARPGESVTSC